MGFSVQLHRNIEKQLQKIPKKQRDRVVKTIRSLSYKPRPSNSLHLDGNLYRIRMGQYRIIYAIFEDEVIVFICKVTRRSESTYKKLKILLASAQHDIDSGQ